MTQKLTSSSVALLTRNNLYQLTNMLQGAKILPAMRVGKPSDRELNICGSVHHA